MSVERLARSSSGWGMLAMCIILYVAATAVYVWSGFGFADAGVPVQAPVCGIVGATLLLAAACVVTNGFFTLQPGQARVCVLFGKYVGTVRAEGFRWANPFFSRKLGEVERDAAEKPQSGGLSGQSSGTAAVTSKVSVRVRTLNGDRLKVNDKMGNPIEIASVVAWHVEDTAKALFDVDDYERYVSMQSETALRHVAGSYAYDHMEESDSAADAGQVTLRSGTAEVSQALRAELGGQLAAAGVAVDDARLTHLAYAPEIAQAMLRRQQAEAVISARRKIVEGAVSMVNLAVNKLSADGIIELDDERKAAMASNLMVVLCGDGEAQPVINAGSLYQ